MPPKKKEGPSKKTEMKKKEKIVEDKTFGLKNKKGSKQQKYIQTVTQQVKFGSQSGRKLELLKQQEKAKKEDKKKDTQSLNELFKPVTVQKVEKGADPKSVLCSFFKQGHCTKGEKCKFSHDLNIERKAEKRSMYCDMRDSENDTMENWDEDKLRDVVNKKHSEAESKKPKTDIICKFFLDALEKSKYGWFWECPSGDKCFYRHALPPGFVLQKDKKKAEKEVEISIEELVEKERANLGEKQTRVTYETFMAWKKKKIKEKADKARKEQDKKKNEFKAGKGVGLSGRDMFTFRPDLATEDQDDGAEDEAAYDMNQYQNDVDDDGDTVVHNVTLEMFSTQVQDSLQNDNPTLQGDLSEAAGGTIDNDVNVPIDEDLFADDDDLDELEENLENIGIQP